VLAFDPQEGWFDFVVEVTEEERLWSGAADGALEGVPLGQLPVWLGARRERPAGCLGTPPSGELDARCDAALSADLRLGLDVVRRPKDEIEIERMRVAERATRAAFAAAVPALVEGSTERSVQVELETAALRAGADAMAYDTIVGAGTNSAVLHFMPTDRRLSHGDLVLIDAGADYRQYACDITRTYPVGGQLSPEQAELHAVVHAAERAAIERCVPGTEWVDVHMTAAQVIAEGLVAFGVLRGEPSALVQSGAVWLFFPHGIGHSVGLGVRDAHGPLPSRRDTPAPVKNLRINLPLEPGYVVTVEPGVYFVPGMLQDPGRRARHRDTVDWDRVDGLMDFGGIRIEDNVLITDSGHEILTADVPVLG
jgi:Xaa-Pro aminopeptidase